MIESLTLQDDGPDGMTLILEGVEVQAANAAGATFDFDTLTIPVGSDALLSFLRSREVKAFLEHVAEGERERALYDAATPEERARVIGPTPELDEVLREMYGEDWGAWVDTDGYCKECGMMPSDGHRSACRLGIERTL